MVDEIVASPVRVALVRDRKIWSFSTLENLLKKFSPGERLALYVCTIVLGSSLVFLLADLNNTISIEIPTRGGTFTEGETGPARFINPLLSLSQADQDLSALIYSGLTRALPDGTYVADLADHYAISTDGTVYTFFLRKNLTFHDGAPLTAADILFTVSAAQNSDIKSSHRADWEGVSATSPDPYTVIFTLPHAYSPFIENTTLGILPKARWESVTAEEFPFSPLNTRPIGSGPFKIDVVRTDSTGAATRYDLVPFDDFVLDGPYLARLSFVFFPNTEALVKAFNMRQIDAVAGLSPTDLDALKRTDVSVIRAPLPRVFGVFFNENHNSALTDVAVRHALESAVDKEKIVNAILKGYGKVTDGPIPVGTLGNTLSSKPIPFTHELPRTEKSGTSTPESIIADARSILKKAGWSQSTSTNQWVKKKVTLSLKLATADEPELAATANAIADAWREIGVQVDVQVYPLSDFNNSVLRPRNYDAILFGEVVGRSADLFAFWHSSQRNDPGLNLAMYANAKADSILSLARTSTNKKDRDALYAQFASIIQKDQPAVFLYSPDFIYIVPGGIQGMRLGALTTPAERFHDAYEWYTDTNRVWTFFTDKK